MEFSGFFTDKEKLKTAGVEIQKRVKYLVNTNIVVICFMFLAWSGVAIATKNYSASLAGYALSSLFFISLLLVKRNRFIAASNLTVISLFLNIMVVVFALPYDSYLVIWRPATYMLALLIVCGMICFHPSQIILPALLSLVSLNVVTWLIYIPGLGEITPQFISSYVAINMLLFSISLISYFSFSFSRDLVKHATDAEDYILNIFNSIPSVLFSTDQNGFVTRWNKKTEEMTGVKAVKAVGRYAIDVYPDFHQDIHKIPESIMEKRVITEKRKTETPGMPSKCEIITISPLVEGGSEGVVVRIDDVTREEEIVKQLNQSRKMEAVGKLAGGVAHDFNNMLGGILGAAQLLKTTDEKSPEFIDLIISAARRASDLTSSLLMLSRKSSRTVEPLYVSNLIEDTAALLERSIDKKIKILFENNAGKTVIMGDGSQIQNALLNMGINSAKAMPEGGTLSFITETIFLDEKTTESLPFNPVSGRYALIEIRDTGCGIPLENIDRIFEPFYTTREAGDGTGLGLAAVYGIIKDHKGSIKVYSEVGSGTAFYLYFPISENQEAVPVKPVIEKGKGIILLADDEQIIRHTTCKILESLGYQVLIAENGEQAINMFKENADRIDLVILDMIMPVKNGRETFYELKKYSENVKVLVTSGFSKEEDLEGMYKDGLAGYMKKPFNIEDLSKTVKKIITETVR